MKHWTDNHISVDEETQEFVGYGEDGLELLRNVSRSYVAEGLEDYSARVLEGSLPYKNGKLMAKIMKIICDLRLMYYVDCDTVVRTYWKGQWVAWHEVMKFDKRLEV